MKMILGSIGILFLNALLAIPLHARLVEEKDIYFSAKAEDLLRGDIHYSLSIMDPKRILKVFPEVTELDTQDVLSHEGSIVVLGKAMFTITKPVGFFDHEHIKDGKFVQHMLGKNRVSSINENIHKISVPGQSPYTYFMRSSFDSDDISTLPTSKAISAVTAIKKIDVITKSASSIVLKELNRFTGHAQAGLTISSYVSLKENRTLVIYYSLMALNKGQGQDAKIKSQWLREVENIRNLIDSYSEK